MESIASTSSSRNVQGTSINLQGSSQGNLLKNGERVMTSFLYSGNDNNDDLDCLDDLEI